MADTLILLKHQCTSSFIQNYTKIKLYVYIAVKYYFALTCNLIMNKRQIIQGLIFRFDGVTKHFKGQKGR